MHRISGVFEVTIEPQAEGESDDLTLGRLSIDKVYRGALEAKAQGEMLTVLTSVAGSAAYVAVERVSGAVDGRQGSFALVHRGIRTAQGTQELLVTVVPDSGSGELLGLTGTMGIRIEDGQHFYDFDYALPRDR